MILPVAVEGVIQLWVPPVDDMATSIVAEHVQRGVGIRVAVGVAYGSDLDHVIETLEGVARENSAILEAPAPRVRFRAFGDSSLNFELLGWIADPGDRGRLQHELNCAIYKALQRENIEIPFPQRDLHVRTMPATDN